MRATASVVDPPSACVVTAAVLRRRLSELPEAPRSHVVAHAGVRMPLAHHAAGGGGASGLRGAVVGSPPKTPVPRRSADQPNRRAAGLSPSARPSLEVFTPEATLSGVVRRSLSGQHASTPAASAAHGPYQCVALGDPIMDLIGFERGNLLDDHGFEKGGCVAVDHYDDILRLQSRVPGGSAANVVKGIAGLAALRSGSTASAAAEGAPPCAFVGKVGEDAAGHEYAKRLAAAGVQPLLVRSHAGTPTAEALSVVSPDGQRTMRPYLGAAKELDVDDLPLQAIAESRMLHLEGYALYRPEVAEAAVASARAAGALVSLDLASFELVRFLRADVLRFLAWVDLVFCNEDEAAVLVGAEEYVGAEGGVPDDVVANAVAFLRDHCAPGAVVTVSRGRQGCVTAGGAGAGAPVAVPANRVQAKDTTGAGDLFTSGFLSAYLAGEPLDVCARTGCFMGAQVVQVLGAELPPEAWGAVRDALPYFTAEHRPEITTTTATTTFSPVAAKQHTSAVTGEVAC